MVLKETRAQNLDGDTVWQLIDGDELIGEGSLVRLEEVLDDMTERGVLTSDVLYDPID